MALNLTQELPSGCEYEYHRILSMTYTSTKVRVCVQSYKSQQARTEGKQPVRTWQAEFDRSSFNPNEAERPQAYAKLKASVLTGAEDC